MSNNYFKIFFLILVSVLTSCNKSGVKNPETIGKQAFKILNQFNTINQKDYLAFLLPIENIRKIDKSLKKINSRKRTLQNQMWYYDIKNDYNSLKNKGHKYGIDWSKISYQKFINNNSNDAIRSGGILYFKYKKDIFKIDVKTIYNGKEYKLTHLKGLFKQ